MYELHIDIEAQGTWMELPDDAVEGIADDPATRVAEELREKLSFELDEDAEETDLTIDVDAEVREAEQ